MLLAPLDRVAPLRTRLADLLREALSAANKRHGEAHGNGLSTLETSAIWKTLKEEDRTRILTEVQLVTPGAEEVGTDEALLAALDKQNLPARTAQTDAVPGRVQRAIEIAARLLEPKVRTVTLERTTLRSEGDVRTWLGRQETTLLTEVKQGPVLIN